MANDKRADFLGLPIVKIDSAGSSSHTHPNLETLNLINDSGSGYIITTSERNNLHTHANKTTIDDITAADLINWDLAYSNNHTHSNKAVLDGITNYGSGKIITDTERSHYDIAYTNNHTHSNKTALDGITDKGSGSIITVLERSNLHSHTNKAIIDGITDVGSGAIITSTERNNLHVHINKTVLDHITDQGSGIVISTDERTRLNRINTVRIITGTDTALVSDDIILCNKTTAFTLSLLTAVGYNGRLEIININNGIVTIDPYNTENINGATTFQIIKNEGLVLISDGTNWRTL